MTATIYYIRVATAIGEVWVSECDGAITAVSFTVPAPGVYRETALLARAAKQLTEYFQGARQSFDLPLAPQGTAFQHKVWQALLAIPYGETCTYKEVARRIGVPGGSRAVGMACNRNPIAVIVPCHRVVGCGRRLVGYAYGVELKRFLLQLELKTHLFE